MFQRRTHTCDSSSLPLAGALIGFACLIGVSCDLLRDATTFNLRTGQQSYTVDTAAFGITLGAGTVPRVSCAQSNNCALTAALGCNEPDCQVSCGGDQNCQLAVPFSSAVTVDISQQIQGRTGATVLERATISAVEYQVSQNTLNIATPDLAVYVGPGTSAGINDNGVILLGTIPAVTAGQTPSGRMTVSAAGRVALVELIKNYQEPFRFYVGADFVFVSGDPVPAGAIKFAVEAIAEVSLL